MILRKTSTKSDRVSKGSPTPKRSQAQKSKPAQDIAPTIRKIVETEPDVETLKCCNIQFDKIYNFKRHVSRAHSNDSKACPVCDKQFSHKDNMLKHQKIHEKE